MFHRAFVARMRVNAVDECHDLVYWNDRGKLKQATLDGVNEKVIIDTGKLSHISFIITCSNSAVKSKPITNTTVNIKIITFTFIFLMGSHTGVVTFLSEFV